MRTLKKIDLIKQKTPAARESKRYRYGYGLITAVYIAL